MRVPVEDAGDEMSLADCIAAVEGVVLWLALEIAGRRASADALEDEARGLALQLEEMRAELARQNRTLQ